MPLVDPPEEPTFYMTVNSNRSQLLPLIESGEIPVMRNIMQFRNKDSLRVSEPYAGRYVLDSGGYTAMDEFGGDFQWTVEEYHNWSRDMYDLKPFDWVATMDLACEPAFDEDMTVKERMIETVNNTVDLLELEPEYPVLPVLQGREVHQWLESYDMLRDYGIDPDYVGIGTLCRQTSGNDIKQIIRAIRTQTDIGAFHGFGVKATAFKAGAVMETADSQAWSWPLKYGMKLTEGESGMVREKYGDHDEKVHRETFKTYYDHVSELHQLSYSDEANNQVDLSEFVLPVSM